MTDADHPERLFSVQVPNAEEVYSRASQSVTLRDLDSALGYSAVWDERDLRSTWYRAASMKPLHDLDQDDLCFVLNAGIHLPLMLPTALYFLETEPTTEETAELQVACAAAARMLRKSKPQLMQEARQTFQRMGALWAIALLEATEEPPAPSQPSPPAAPTRNRVKSPYRP